MKYLLFISLPIILCLLLLAGCSGSGERVVKDGDTVSVHYTGSLQDGTIFDSSRGRDPLTFTVGAGQMITGFDNAVRGMKVNEVKTVTLPPEQAYGPRRSDLIITMAHDKFPKDMTLTVGQKVSLQNNLGQQLTATVIEIKDTEVVLDANHELAGKTLIFEIELIKIF
jgi:peptidylprolyl isomerase